jgi:hypothetical protein
MLASGVRVHVVRLRDGEGVRWTLPCSRGSAPLVNGVSTAVHRASCVTGVHLGYRIQACQALPITSTQMPWPPNLWMIGSQVVHYLRLLKPQVVVSTTLLELQASRPHRLAAPHALSRWRPDPALQTYHLFHHPALLSDLPKYAALGAEAGSLLRMDPHHLP